MALRALRKAFIRLSLVTIPAKIFSAAAKEHGEIHLHQLHAECESRIKYQKTCPIHGEVLKEEIVSGYEYAKGKYVAIDPDELKKLRTESDKIINIEEFIAPDALDTIYLTEQTYYLVPDGRVAERPFIVLRDAMEKRERVAIAQAVLYGKEQLLLLRPVDGLLAMTTLSYAKQYREPTYLEEELPKGKPTAKELELAETLIDNLTNDKFDYAKFKDPYTEKLKQLIDAKVAGEDIVAQPKAKTASVINLMDALKQSVAQAGEDTHKPRKRMAASRRKGTQKKRRRKAS